MNPHGGNLGCAQGALGDAFFSQDLREINLEVAGELEVECSQWNSYIASLPADAVVTIKLGQETAPGYNLAKVPLRRAGAPFRWAFLSWAAQAGKGSGFVIFGLQEEAGVR